MPVSVKKVDGYQVSHGGKVSAKHASAKNAMAQKRLLLAVSHGFKPTGQPSKMVMSKHVMKMRAKGKK